MKNILIVVLLFASNLAHSQSWSGVVNYQYYVYDSVSGTTDTIYENINITPDAVVSINDQYSEEPTIISDSAISLTFNFVFESGEHQMGAGTWLQYNQSYQHYQDNYDTIAYNDNQNYYEWSDTVLVAYASLVPEWNGSSPGSIYLHLVRNNESETLGIDTPTQKMDIKQVDNYNLLGQDISLFNFHGIYIERTTYINGIVSIRKIFKS